VRIAAARKIKGEKLISLEADKQVPLGFELLKKVDLLTEQRSYQVGVKSQTIIDKIKEDPLVASEAASLAESNGHPYKFIFLDGEISDITDPLIDSWNNELPQGARVFKNSDFIKEDWVD